MFFRVILLFFSFISFGQTNYDNDSLILWNESRNLRWNDFKDEVDRDSSNASHFAEGNISIEFTLKRLTLDEISNLNVIACFHKKKSWSFSKTKETLLHEQLHFDIAEIFARKMRKSFASLKANKVIDIREYYKIYNKYFDEMEKYHEQYDDETIFVRAIIQEKSNSVEYQVVDENENSVKDSKLYSFGQKKWMNKLRKELKDLEDYELEFRIDDLID